MSEYRSPHNDGHDPYILIWEYGNDIRRAEFTERWAKYDETGWTVWYFRLVDGGIMTFSAREWEQKDDVNHLTTIWMKPVHDPAKGQTFAAMLAVRKAS